MSETLSCPRCHNSFTCSKDDIGACACANLSLRPETKEFLAHTFYACLCNDCLLAIEALVIEAGRHPFPGRGGELVEGLHYYKEDIYRVFTPLYLASREYCCRSGCRHCPYGFKSRHAQ